MFTSSLFALVFSPLVASYLVSPPGTPYPEASADCSGWVEGSKSLTCATIEATYSITASDFEAWNPLAAAAGTCTIDVGFYYCVQINYGNTNPNTTTTLPSTISSPTATTGDGISTPTPHQTGIASNCNKFYLVVSGDECGTIASQYSISLSDFYSWNPAVGTNCQYLGLGDYVCVDIIGFIPTGTTLTTTTTSPGNGITTPTPYQPGMVSSCDQFHLVSSGDQCGLIASQYGITLSQFYAWNPAVGSSCAYLYLGDYVCVAVLGATSVTSPPPTSTGNGITTPTPYQSGMASNCDTFHFVVSGDQCGLIASQYGISLNQFYTWNPAVGSSCQYLDLGDYVCVDVIGATGVTTTTTPTTGPNGVVTPTPYQPGMTTNCDAFHYVISGDQCGNIASQYGVSLSQFYAWNPAVGSSCQYLDLGDYVCVGILG